MPPVSSMHHAQTCGFHQERGQIPEAVLMEAVVNHCIMETDENQNIAGKVCFLIIPYLIT